MLTPDRFPANTFRYWHRQANWLTIEVYDWLAFYGFASPDHVPSARLWRWLHEAEQYELN